MSLRSRLILPLITVGLAVGGYLHLVWMPRVVAAAEANTLRMVERQRDAVIEGLVPLLLGGELDQVFETLGMQRTRNPEWTGVLLTDSKGRRLYPLAGEPVAMERAGDTVKRLETPITFLGSDLGRLVIGVDVEPALDAVRTQIHEAEAWLALALALLVLTMLVTVELAVRRPVRQLSRAALSLAQQRFDHPLPDGGSREIIALVESFGTMRGNLKASQAALKRNLDDLGRLHTDLERFTYIASHDLQEPVRSIVMFSQLLERRFPASIDTEAREFLEHIVRNGQRLSHLVEDMLAYNRLTRQASRREQVDLNELVREVLVGLEDAIDESAATLDIGELPEVTCNGIEIGQLFQNLLSNALKFVRDGVPPKVQVRASEREDGWEFTVADNGIGVPPDFRCQVFELFRRVAPSARYPGSGVGLSICRYVVEHHNGRIWIGDGEEGQPGCTVHFTLPKAVEEADQAA